MHMSDRIERTIDLEVPIHRLWRVLTEPQEVSAWFGARFEEPFLVGKTALGTVTYPGYEGLKFDINVVAKNDLKLFSFAWHPYAIDRKRDYSGEKRTLVEFHLQPIPRGTRLTVTETGFDALPADRAAEAYAANGPGWEDQLIKIAKLVAA
jgi:uncharacterized protein YndB with AHSA1/START domain